jgi:predicted permease
MTAADRVRSAMAAARSWWRAHRHRNRLESEIEQELEFHLAQRAARDVAGGATEAESRRTARLRFGPVARIREDVRSMYTPRWLAGVARDLAHGLRRARLHPVFAIATTSLLAVGLGVNVGVHDLMLRLVSGPTPGLADVSRLALIGRTDKGTTFDLLSYPDALSLRARCAAFSDVAVFADRPLTVDAGGQTVRARGQFVSSNFFAVIGASLREGTGFGDANDGPRAAGGLVVGAAFRRRIWPSSQDISTATVRVNRHDMRVVGVAPDGFRGVGGGEPVDVWIPFDSARVLRDAAGESLDDLMTNRSATWLSAVGRLAPGVSLAKARSAAEVVAVRLQSEFREDEGRGVAVEPVGGAVDPAARPALRRQWAMLGGFALLLLVTVCLNVGGVLLVQLTSRSAEIRVRMSLGASPVRVIGQLMAEYLALAALGGIAALGLAHAIVLGAIALIPADLPIVVTAGAVPSGGAITATIVLVLLSAAVVCVPAGWTLLRDPARHSIPAWTGDRVAAPSRLRHWLAAGQVAVAMALLVLAGLLGRSARNAGAVQLGFDPNHLMTGYVDLAAAGYSGAASAEIQQRLLDIARQTPGVTSVAMGQHVPLQGSSLGLPIDIEGDATGTAPPSLLVRLNAISPAFFSTLRTEVLVGREFSATDDAGASRVALVNETCRRTCFGGANPLGRRIRLFQESVPRIVIGVAADSKYSQPLEDVRPTVFVPLAQREAPSVGFIVRTVRPEGFVTAWTDALRRLDDGLPVYDVRSLGERLDRGLWQPRMLAILALALGAASVILAGLGVFGVVAQVASERRRELAIRAALGARPLAIAGIVAEQGMLMLVVGAAIGGLCGAVLSRPLRSVLFNVAPNDPWNFAFAAAVVSVLVLAACAWPAWRAAVEGPGSVLKS